VSVRVWVNSTHILLVSLPVNIVLSLCSRYCLNACVFVYGLTQAVHEECLSHVCLWVCVCACVCMCVYTSVYASVYLYACMYLSVRICVYMCMGVCVPPAEHCGDMLMLEAALSAAEHFLPAGQVGRGGRNFHWQSEPVIESRGLGFESKPCGPLSNLIA
jgi:hypothetical protein